MDKSNLSIMVGGEILWYQRKITIHNKNALHSFPKFDGISDILRIQLWRWVQTLDDPHKTLIWLDKKESKPKKIKREYIVMVTCRMQDNDDSEQWQHYSIRLNRKGIIDVQAIPNNSQ